MKGIIAGLAVAGVLLAACGMEQEQAADTSEASPPPEALPSPKTEERMSSGLSGGPPPSFPFTSPAFEDGETLPTEFTCEGEGVSPPLEWSELPEGTKQLTLFVLDMDVTAYGAGGQFTHWVVYGIDPEVGGFPQGAVPEGALEGQNSHAIGQQGGPTGWAAPCPPPEDDPHTYRFSLSALSRPIRLFGTDGRTPRPGEGPQDILYASSNDYNDVLGRGGLDATYGRD